jgi:Domain of unknown function (DUF4439)
VTELDAMQAALAAEHATIYGYGVAGAVLRGSDRDYALTVMDEHLRLRDQLVALIRGRHAEPVAAEPAYRLPTPVTDRASARALAEHLEQGGAGTMWDLVAAAASKSHLRALAIGWLSQAAVRAAHWGARQPLPGQPS